MTASNQPAAASAVKWARLSRRERVQALRAFTWLAVIAILLRCCPYRVLRAWVARVPARGSAAGKITIAECGMAVRRASSVIRRPGCLARALAAACMLRRDGQCSTLVIGAGFDHSRAFAAHAWLVAGDTIVVGEETAADCAVLLRDVIPGS